MVKNLPPGERKCLTDITGRPNMLVVWYLMASYLYYHRDESLLRDETYDRICKELLEKWGGITHYHRDFIRKEDLPAGTCFLRLGSFPSIVKASASAMMKLDYVWEEPENA